MKRIVNMGLYLCASGLAFAAFGCSASAMSDGEATESTEQAAHSGTEIRPQDDCDPATFGSLCNPNFPGQTTLASFQAQLAATKKVADWEYSSTGHLSGGKSLNVVSRGGETHTFTTVAQYGGGIVPALNTASGNPVPAPECLAAPNARNVFIPSGTTQVVTSGPGKTLPPGHYLVQCCIHPWMRTVVDVN